MRFVIQRSVHFHTQKASGERLGVIVLAIDVLTYARTHSYTEAESFPCLQARLSSRLVSHSFSVYHSEHCSFVLQDNFLIASWLVFPTVRFGTAICIKLFLVLRIKGPKHVWRI